MLRGQSDVNVKVNGNKIRKLRTRRLMEREEFAQEVGIHAVTVARIETGQTSVRASTLKKIAEVLDVAPELLSRGESKIKTAAS